MKLGIIGTAGRGEDATKLKLGHWILMKGVAQSLCLALKANTVVSGGAAFADHLAIELFVNGNANLSLHLPAKFDKRFVETGSQYDAGRTSNYYHDKFSKVIGHNSFDDFRMVFENRCIKKYTVTFGTDFKVRNTLVANESDFLLAFTFGNGPELKDGGTKDTMDKFLKKRAKEEERLKELDLNGIPHGENHLRAFHFDLNSKRLFEI